MADHEASRKMHLKLYRTLGENMPKESQNFKDFLLHLPLTPRDQTDNGDSMESLLKRWESRGYIGLGKYDALIRTLREADLGKMAELVTDRAKEIKNQLDIESKVPDPTVRHAQDPPSDGPQDKGPGYIS